jgi:hypothetical protein
MDICNLSDDDLLSGVGRLVVSERGLIAQVVVYLGEIEERRLHLKAGFSSMFEYCTKKLGLSEGEAFRRILAARLGRRFPSITGMLVSGSANLSTLELVRERLTEENHVELLEAVSGKSKRDVEAVLATWFPRPDVPSKIRKLPDRSAPTVASGLAGHEQKPLGGSRGAVSSRANIEALSEARFKIEFTVSATLREKLELCRDLMSHANPSRELAPVIERALDLLLADLGRKRLARAKRPRRATEAGTKSRRISNATRRKVFERDGLRCTYVSPDGRRCEARAFLELDHVHPRGLGGGDDIDNIRVRCRAHNQLSAEESFGREHVEHFRQRKYENHGAFEKVRLALTTMGFRDGEARRAIAEVEKAHAGTTRLTLEQALRDALAIATAA